MAIEMQSAHETLKRELAEMQTCKCAEAECKRQATLAAQRVEHGVEMQAMILSGAYIPPTSTALNLADTMSVCRIHKQVAELVCSKACTHPK